MKILLDESLPRKLRNTFGQEHEVWTVRDKDWLGEKNGELLRLMIVNNFELFITVDRNLPYQQDLTKFPLTIVILCGVNNRLETLQKLIPKMFERFEEGNLQNVIEIF